MTTGTFQIFRLEGATKFEDTSYYRDLLGKCQVITCAHTSYYWAGEIVDVFGIPALVSKMPQRIWVGLESKAEPGIEYGTYRHYDPATSMFKDVDVFETTRAKSITFLNEWIGQQAVVGQISHDAISHGFRMHQFAETLYGRSHVSPKLSGGRAIAEATAMAVAYLGLTNERLIGWQASGTLVIPCEDPLLNETCYLAWELAAIGYGGYHAATDLANALIDSPYPVLARSAPVVGVPSKDDEPVPKNARDLSFAAWRLTNLGLPETTPLWSHDITVVFSGQNKRTLAALDVARLLRDMDNAGQRSRSWLPKGSGGSGRVSDSLIRAGERLTIECLYRLFWSQRSPYSKELVGYLNRAINQCRHFMAMLGLTSVTMEQLMTFLDEEAGRILGQAGFPPPGIKPTGEGIGGGVLMVIPATGLRRQLPQIVERARGLTTEGLDVRVEYASWEHGFPSQGVRIIKAIEDTHSRKPDLLPETGVDLKPTWARRVFEELATLEELPNAASEKVLIVSGFRIRVSDRQVNHLLSKKGDFTEIELLVDKGAQAVFFRTNGLLIQAPFRAGSGAKRQTAAPYHLLCIFAEAPGMLRSYTELKTELKRRTGQTYVNIRQAVNALAATMRNSIPLKNEGRRWGLDSASRACVVDYGDLSQG